MRRRAAGQVQLGPAVHAVESLQQPAGQRLLMAWQDGHARPRCLCTDTGIELQVVRRGHRWHLAKLPGTGFLHAADCPWGDGPQASLTSGAVVYGPAARYANDDGAVHLLYEPMVSRAVPAPAVSLDGVLDTLIERAQMFLAAPEQPARHWGALRSDLGRAAGEIHLDESLLSGGLLIAEHFRKDGFEAALARQEGFLSGDGPRFILGRLKEIVGTEHGWRLSLKDLPSTRFWVPRRLGQALAQREDGYAILDAPPTQALVLAQVRPSHGNHAHSFQVQTLALRRVDAQFRPAQSEPEDRVAAQLGERHLAFERVLRFDAPWEAPLADYVVTAGTRRRLVFVLHPTRRLTADAAKRTAAKRLLAAGELVSVFEDGTWLHPPFLT